MSEEQEEQGKTYCTDCLKTKGFGIAVPLIIISTILTLVVATGVMSSWWLFFIGGWALVFFLTLGSFIVAGFCLSEYCKIKGDNYKEPFAIGFFVVLTVVGIIVSIAIAITLPENIEYWFSANRNW